MTVSSAAAAPPTAGASFRAGAVRREPDRARKGLARAARPCAALRVRSRIGFSTAVSDLCGRSHESLPGCRPDRNLVFPLDAAGAIAETWPIPSAPAGATMALEGLLDTEHERAARRLIEQAGTILTGLHGDMPEGFAAQIFARAAPEDLARYEPREVAALAEEAWLFLKERPPGTAKVRMQSRGGPIGSERIRTVSILEIVNDNMPFLLDSIMGELTEQGLDVRLVVHPVFAIERDTKGSLIGFSGEGAPTGAARRESFIHIHTERVEDEARRAALVQSIEQALADVRVSVEDWRPMRARVGEVIADMRGNPPQLPVDEVAEAVQFLEWLLADNFTFLGVREYSFPPGGGEVEPRFETGLGILRAHDVRILRRGHEFVAITPEILEFLKEPKALIITKANVRSRVHRRVHMDYIGVKRFDPDGHSGKALVNVLESYPRDELFQIDEDTLFRFAIEILYLDERPRVRVLARRDRFDRFVSVLVFVPRERYDSGTRIAIGNFLGEIYNGRPVAFFPFFPEGPLVRVHFIIARFEGATPNPDRSMLEQAVERIIRTWTDALAEALTLVHDPAKAQALLRRYAQAFPVSYREDYGANVAIGDIRMVESLSAARPLGVEFYGRHGADPGSAGLKVFSRERKKPGRCGCTTCCSNAPTAARSSSKRSSSGSRPASSP